MRLDRALALSLAFSLSLAAAPASAGKVDAYVGAFDFAAKTSLASGSKSGLGAYKISYLMPVADQVEIGIGYSLIFSDVIGGDSVYGFDIEAAYYPFTPAGSVRTKAGDAIVQQDFMWRPFVLLGFNARQFQSIATQYNGFSGGVGVERTYDQRVSFKGLLRYVNLQGPSKANAREISILGGMSFGF